MKSKLRLLSLFLVLNVATNYAQSATQANIAVQGIARDSNNTALASKTMSFTFTFYYFNASNLEETIFEESKSVTTDAFGVFSYVINPAAVNNSKFANNIAYLRIKNGTILISDEKLSHVPYAIAANNGVPTGSIMPFIGTVAPEGWALCNGAALPATATVLIAMVGPNAPNLQGMFLRGAGTSPVNNQAGPALKATQQDAFESHLHAQGTLANSTNGSHVHDWLHNTEQDDSGGGDSYEEFTLRPTAKAGSSVMSPAGDHSHTISGSTSSTGDNETRPVNYGVNYIIKL